MKTNPAKVFFFKSNAFLNHFVHLQTYLETLYYTRSSIKGCVNASIVEKGFQTFH